MTAIAALLALSVSVNAVERGVPASEPVNPVKAALFREAPLTGAQLPLDAGLSPTAALAPVTAEIAAPQAAVPLATPEAPAPNAQALADFGAKNGVEIANKDRILSDIDRLLGRSRPPALEYIFVRPFVMLKVAGLGLGTNPYGHAVVRYTMPGGEQKAMNIVGKPGRQMVNFMKPEDYLYGTGVFDTGSEQGGVYNRAMVGLRFEELPAEKILALDRYYTGLMERGKEGDASFELAFSDIRNFLARIIPGHQAEVGNCARWVSMGLKAAGLLRAAMLWPKAIWVKLYERYKRANPDNVHVVSYRRPHHAVHTYGADADAHGLVAPFRYLKDRQFWDLEKRADVIVDVPPGSITAEAALVKRP